MKPGVVVAILLLCTAAAPAQPGGPCPVPGYMLYGDSPLQRVAAAARERHLDVVVLGTTSSMLPGADGAALAYPARLEADLKRRLPNVAVKVANLAKPRQSAEQMAETIPKLLPGPKPALVIWQTGTFEALRGRDPELFRSQVEAGVERLQSAGIDVILVNMQYSPRTESIIALAPYVDALRWVAREREVPLFDRLAIMRHWNDTGAIDLYAATKDFGMAKRVHDCVGRALASLIIDAAHLEELEGKPPQ